MSLETTVPVSRDLSSAIYDRRIYSSYDAALKRVETLKSTGVWPGIRTLRTGEYQLTYDPGLPRLQ